MSTLTLYQFGTSVWWLGGERAVVALVVDGGTLVACSLEDDDSCRSHPCHGRSTGEVAQTRLFLDETVLLSLDHVLTH